MEPNNNTTNLVKMLQSVGYTCDECGRIGCKLWRLGGTAHTKCIACLRHAGVEGAHMVRNDGSVGYRDYSLGKYTPAVLQLSRNGVTFAPSGLADAFDFSFWKALPLLPLPAWSPNGPQVRKNSEETCHASE